MTTDQLVEDSQLVRKYKRTSQQAERPKSSQQAAELAELEDQWQQYKLRVESRSPDQHQTKLSRRLAQTQISKKRQQFNNNHTNKQAS